MKKISFILHGKYKGNHKLVSRIRETFGNSYELVFSFTQHIGHGKDLAKEAALSNSGYIISVSGDGTLNEVANGIMFSGNKNVKLGLLPHGTGNDFSKTILVSNNVLRLKQMIDQNMCREIDLGLVHFKNIEGNDESRYFINITDVGLGGFIAQKLSGSSKWLGATLTFQKAIITTFLTYKHQLMKTKADDFIYEGKILSYIIANGKYFGGGLGIAPDAKPDDGWLHITLGGEISLWDYLLNLSKVRQCKKIEHSQMKYLRAKEISIETPSQPIDMDGEFIGYTPMRISIVPKTLQFIC
jgi:YegS/Rv2252/BmrU family lipid kinase